MNAIGTDQQLAVGLADRVAIAPIDKERTHALRCLFPRCQMMTGDDPIRTKPLARSIQ
jgi:hypothetical protein